MTVKLGKPIPRAYRVLLEQFLLRPIESDEQLAQATALADELVGRRNLRREEEQYLEVLCDLMEAFEDQRHPVDDVSAGRMLHFLIEQRGVTQQTVSRETGIANSTISALIKEDRLMTRSQIETLAGYFGVAPAVFLPGNEVPTKATSAR
jgi:antitoxin component HigA of HigAB toxin-antitoxin module